MAAGEVGGWTDKSDATSHAVTAVVVRREAVCTAGECLFGAQLGNNTGEQGVEKVSRLSRVRVVSRLSTI